MSSINAQNEVSVGSCPTCGQLCQFVALGGDQDQIDYVPPPSRCSKRRRRHERRLAVPRVWTGLVALDAGMHLRWQREPQHLSDRHDRLRPRVG